MPDPVTTASLAITVLGRDRPGIIAQTAEALAACGMNLEDSSMTLLRGHFAMTLVCAGRADPTEVRESLADLAEDGSLTVDVRTVRAPAEAAVRGSSYLVTVHGADRLGIVARLAGVLARAGANVSDLTTRLAADLYVLAAEVEVPEGADVAALERDLHAAATELGVEVSLRELERDEL